MSDEDLKERIRKEMVADYSNALERNFQLAKQMIKITDTGKVDVLVKDKLSSQDKVTLYLIGKRYAHTAGFAPSEYVGNDELMNELGLKEGTLFPTMMALRNKNMLEQGPKEGRIVPQAIALNVVESELKSISSRLRKSGWPLSGQEQ